MRSTNIFFILLFFTACASKSVFVSRKLTPEVDLKGMETVEIRDIRGHDSEGFRLTLSNYLTKNSKLKVVTTQTTRELVDSYLRGANRTKEKYPQGDLIIKGEYQEERHPVISEDGSMIYDIIVRTQLELIRSSTGEVLDSDYYVGTARSGVIIKDRYYADRNPLYEGVNEARRRAFYNLVQKFSPRDESVELRLLETEDDSREKLVELIKIKQFDKARDICNKLITSADNKTKASGYYNLAIIEIVQGNLDQSKSLVDSAYAADRNPEILKLIDTINYIKTQPQ